MRLSGRLDQGTFEWLQEETRRSGTWRLVGHTLFLRETGLEEPYDVRLFQPGSIGLTDAKGIGQVFEKENDNVIAFGRKRMSASKQEQSLNSLIDRTLLILKVYTPIDWSIATAGLWEKNCWHSGCVPHFEETNIQLDDLKSIDAQKESLLLNTEQFVSGLPANNALLWGARGTGKSSLIHALLNRFSEQGLRVLQVSKHDLLDLPKITDELSGLPFKFILLCDDLSFEVSDASYKAVKSALDGSVVKSAENILIYATSNRRHLLPEEMADNQNARIVDGQLHQGDAVEEKISLSDRFGLWLSFYPFKQDDYLEIVYYWIDKLAKLHHVNVRFDEELNKTAIRWALAQGVRSGRTAHHFANSTSLEAANSRAWAQIRLSLDKLAAYE